MGIGLQSHILLQSHASAGQEAFTRAAELCSAVRVLFWFKQSGDDIRNRHKFTPEQMQRRKMILEAAYAVMKQERDEELERFFKAMGCRDVEARRLLEEGQDGDFK